MTRDEAVAVVQQTLAFRTDLADTIVTNLKHAQAVLERRPTKPWFLLSERATIRTDTSEPRIPVPTDMLAEFEEGSLMYVPDDASEDEVCLTKEDYTDLIVEYKGEAAGKPKCYARVGDYFRIFPTPDSRYQIRMIYYKQDTVLDTNVENEWLKYLPFLMIGTAGGILVPGLRDPEATKTFKMWEREGLVQLYNENETQRHANREYQMGGPH